VEDKIIMNLISSLSNKRKLPLKNRQISIIILGKNNLKFGLLILSLAAVSILLSVWVNNNNNNNNALALLDTQQKQKQQQSGISTSKIGYSGGNEIPSFLISNSSGPIATTSVSRDSSNSATAITPNLTDSLLGDVGNGASKVIQSSNDSTTAALLVDTHIINANGGTRQASDFSNCIDTSNGGSKSIQCGTGSEGASVSIVFDAGPYKVYQNPNNPVSGYTVSYSKDCSGVIKAGETKICTITYHDNSGSP
jgi:hypothetical protein